MSLHQFLQTIQQLHPIDILILKMERADHHLAEVNQLIRLYESIHPAAFSTELNADKTFNEVRMHVTHDPFVDIGIVVGEFIYY